MPRQKKTLTEFAAQADSPELSLMRKMLREERAAREKAEALQSAILSAARELLEPLRISADVRPYPSQSEAGGAKRGTPEVQILHLSDLQIGQWTPYYDFERFEQSMDVVARKTLALAEVMRRDHPVDELFVALNGDLVEGEDIFPGQAWLSQAGVLEQAVRGAQVIAAKIARLAPHYRRVRVVVTRGNHGRGGRNWCEESNWDLVLGQLVAHLLSRVDNVSVRVESDWYATSEVAGWTVVQTHGDRIRSGGDFPFTAVLKRANLWKTALPKSWDVLLIGHFHSAASFSFQGSWILMNGTMVPTSDYALSYMGLTSRPQQDVAFLHPRIGLTYRCPIYLDRVGAKAD